jgi:hypothetical protein
MKNTRQLIQFALVLALTGSIFHAAFAGVLFQHFETHFEKVPEVTLERMYVTQFHKTFAENAGKTWDAVISILVQQAFLVRLSKEKGTIIFFDVDGLLMKGGYDYMEFPYALLVAQQQQETAVYLLPLAELYEGQISQEDRRKVESALARKANDFLERLEVQITAGNRWQRFLTDKSN